MKSFGVIAHKDGVESGETKYKIASCVEKFVNLREKKILVIVYGVFIISLGVIPLVGEYAVEITTTSTIHVQPPIPTVIASVIIMINGILFISIQLKKYQRLIIVGSFISSAAGVVSAIAAMHYGITVSQRLTSLSDCFYTNYKRLCTCIVVSSLSKVTYNFENTISCKVITNHLREVIYTMTGVYTVAFLSCVATAVYLILLAHRIVMQKVPNVSHAERSEKFINEKHSFEAETEDVLLPQQRDVATQTTSRKAGPSCRHQCRHFVEVKIPDEGKDFVDVTKSRDPPPPYYETVYT